MNKQKRIEAQPNIDLATSLIKLLAEYASTSQQPKPNADTKKQSPPLSAGRR